MELSAYARSYLKVFGFDTQTYATIIYYRLPCVLYFSLLAAVLFLFYRRCFSCFFALFATVIFLFSSVMIAATNYIETDIPFLLFGMLSFLLTEVMIDAHTYPRKLLAACALALSLWAAYVIRPNGITVVIACATGCIIAVWRQRGTCPVKRFFIYTLPYLLFIVLLLVSYQFFPLPTSNSSDIGAAPMVQMVYHFNTNLSLLSNWISQRFSGSQGGVFQYEGLPLVFLALGVVGLWRAGLKQNLHLALFMLGTFIGSCLLDYIQDLRYLYVAMPLVLLFVGYGAQGLSRYIRPHLDEAWQKLLSFLTYALPLIAMTGLVLTTLTSGYEHFMNRDAQRTDSDAYSTEAVDMYQYLRSNTSPDSVVSFYKPRLMYLNTGRLSFRLQVDTANDPDYAYFLLYTDLTKDHLRTVQLELGESSERLALVYTNRLYDLYRLNDR